MKNGSRKSAEWNETITHNTWLSTRLGCFSKSKKLFGLNIVILNSVAVYWDTSTLFSSNINNFVYVYIVN